MTWSCCRRATGDGGVKRGATGIHDSIRIAIPRQFEANLPAARCYPAVFAVVDRHAVFATILLNKKPCRCGCLHGDPRGLRQNRASAGVEQVNGILFPARRRAFRPSVQRPPGEPVARPDHHWRIHQGVDGRHFHH